jgi:hypothetical protein
VVVIGQRAIQSASLSRERAAINNINVITADAIGQFPDNNVAEALQRVSGLSLQRDQGEGRFITIRGANANFNTTTINGLRIPGPEDDSRAVNLDVLVRRPGSERGSLEVADPGPGRRCGRWATSRSAPSAPSISGIQLRFNAEGSYNANGRSKSARALASPVRACSASATASITSPCRAR